MTCALAVFAFVLHILFASAIGQLSATAHDVTMTKRQDLDFYAASASRWPFSLVSLDVS
jgi:hypothetical protein